jgi:hypothetical protein
MVAMGLVTLVVVVGASVFGTWRLATANGPDVNNDGRVRIDDILEVVHHFFEYVPTPTLPPTVTPQPTATSTATDTPTQTPTATLTPTQTSIPGLKDIVVTLGQSFDSVKIGQPTSYTAVARNVSNVPGQVSLSILPGPNFVVFDARGYASPTYLLNPGEWAAYFVTGWYTGTRDTTVTVTVSDTFAEFFGGDGNPANNTAALTTHIMGP